MVYNGDKIWDDWSVSAGNQARNEISCINSGLNQYNEWQSFRAGRTNAQIATALSRTEAEVAEMDACYSAFKEIYDFATNVAGPTQGDRYFSMRVFS